jgi:hypothetical protein
MIAGCVQAAGVSAGRAHFARRFAEIQLFSQVG